MAALGWGQAGEGAAGLEASPEARAARQAERRARRAEARAQAAKGRPVFWAWVAIALGVALSLGAATALVKASQAYNAQAQMLPSRGSSKFPTPTWVPPRPKAGPR